jgi:hypothetical protein
LSVTLHIEVAMKLTLERALLGLAALATIVNVSPLAAQAAKGTPPGACSLLTRELVLRFTPETDKAELSRLFSTPPEEHRLGADGSLCDYAGLTVALNAVHPESFEAKLRKDKAWVPVSGLGNVAWFRSVMGAMGELYVRSGPRTLGVAITIPPGRTAESIKPNAVALAKAVLSRPW